jgi:arsenate reductase (thioredoxin)
VPSEEEPTKYVLFVCNHNAGRSQMAQAFFESLAPPDIRVESAGTEPANQIWPAVVEVMTEVALDISDRKPKKLTREMQLHADLAVTMGCGDACPYVPAAVVDWDIPDPAGESLERVRAVRDIVHEHVHTLLAERLDQIRNDATAHQRRLGQILPAP